LNDFWQTRKSFRLFQLRGRVAPVIERLKSWREANNLSQSRAVEVLQSAGLPGKTEDYSGMGERAKLPQANYFRGDRAFPG
jgi:hypothetical protein